jgi:hypothetical protein
VQRALHRTTPPTARAPQDERHEALAAEIDLRDALSVGRQVQIEGGFGGELRAPGAHHPGQVRAPQLLLAVHQQDDLDREIRDAARRGHGQQEGGQSAFGVGSAARHDVRAGSGYIRRGRGERRRGPSRLVSRLHVVHPVAQEFGAIAPDVAKDGRVSRGRDDLGFPAGTLDQGRYVLGAGQHVVARGGDGWTPQEAPDLLQVSVEVRVDPLPRPDPGRRIKVPPGLHVANLSSGSPRRKSGAGCWLGWCLEVG